MWSLRVASYGAFATAALTALARWAFFVVRVDGISMTPTFQPDDAVLVLRRQLDRTPRRGDVVVCKLPPGVPGPSGYLVKRIAGLGGDPVPGDPATRVPADQVYLQGDGPRSYDSRTFGGLPLRQLHGRVLTRLTPARTSACTT